MIAEKNADGHVDTEATIKIWVDGRRYLRTAEGDGPVNALDGRCASRSASSIRTCRTSSSSNYKVRLLEADHGTERDHPRPARLHRRPGLDGDRSECRRTSSRPPGRRSSTRSSTHSSPDDKGRATSSASPAGVRGLGQDDGADPTREPELGEREEELVLEVLRSGPALAGADGRSASSARSPTTWASTTPSPSPRARRRFTSGCGRSAGARATRSSRARSASSPRPTASSTRASSPSSATSTRSRSTSIRPRPGTRSATTPRACCRSTSSATRRRCPSSSRSPPTGGLGLLEDSCEALGARDSEGRLVGSRGNLATFAFYANKQLTTGEGGMIAVPDDETAAPPSQRAQPGPRARHELGRPRPARLQLPPQRRSGRDRRRPARAPRRDAGGASPRGRAYTERLGGPRRRRARGRGRPGRPRPALRRHRRAAPQLVHLRRPPSGRRRSRRRGRRPRPARDRGQGLHARDPPDGASTASASASRRASSRSPRTPRRACWRCRSSPRSPSSEIDRVCEALAEALQGNWT